MKTAAKHELTGKRVAILVSEGFEQPELTEPRKALDAAGAVTVLIAPEAGEVRAWNSTDWGDRFPVDETIEQASHEKFDALLLPGGVLNPDKLRTIPAAVKFVRQFAQSGLPIAASCHGPIMLIEADALRGRTLTSWPSLKTDITNAGGSWMDVAVAVDDGLVTSRKPADLPAFNAKMLEEFAEGGHPRPGH